jgi:hypothetical protein
MLTTDHRNAASRSCSTGALKILFRNPIKKRDMFTNRNHAFRHAVPVLLTWEGMDVLCQLFKARLPGVHWERVCPGHESLEPRAPHTAVYLDPRAGKQDVIILHGCGCREWAVAVGVLADCPKRTALKWESAEGRGNHVSRTIRSRVCQQVKPHRAT